jgi:hypothetical protein
MPKPPKDEREPLKLFDSNRKNRPNEPNETYEIMFRAVVCGLIMYYPALPNMPGIPRPKL